MPHFTRTMPLSDTVLAAAMKANLLADPNARAVNNAALDAMCSALAKATIDHIKAAAVVTVPAGVAVTVAVPAGTGATVAPGVGSIT